MDSKKIKFKHHKSFFTAYVIAFVFNKTDFAFWIILYSSGFTMILNTSQSHINIL